MQALGTDCRRYMTDSRLWNTLLMMLQSGTDHLSVVLGMRVLLVILPLIASAGQLASFLPDLLLILRRLLY